MLHRSMPSRRLNLHATHRMAWTMPGAAVQSRGDTGVVAQVTRLDPDHTPCPHRLTSTAEPLLSRRGRLDGQASDRRRRHNAVQRWLVGRALETLGPVRHRTAHVLDLGCGRGGDLAKWLVGHPGAGTWGLTRPPRPSTRPGGAREMGVAHQCEFVGDMARVADLGVCDRARRFDVVSCMFALHYCLVDEHAVARDVLGPAAASAAAIVLAVPDFDTILGSPHVGPGRSRTGGNGTCTIGRRWCVTRWNNACADRLVAGLKETDANWSLACDVRFDALGS